MLSDKSYSYCEGCFKNHYGVVGVLPPKVGESWSVTMPVIKTGQILAQVFKTRLRAISS
jgi:hypothetical protein